MGVVTSVLLGTAAFAGVAALGRTLFTRRKKRAQRVAEQKREEKEKGKKKRAEVRQLPVLRGQREARVKGLGGSGNQVVNGEQQC
jgi:hypothetical protein